MATKTYSLDVERCEIYIIPDMLVLIVKSQKNGFSHVSGGYFLNLLLYKAKYWHMKTLEVQILLKLKCVII